MKLHRLAIASLALATVTGLAGCGDKSDTGNGGTTAGAPAATAAATTKAATPVEELTAASEKLVKEPVKLKMTASGGITMNGYTDGVGQKMELTMEAGSSGSIKIRRVGSDMFMKFTGAMADTFESGGKWVHVDARKMPADSAFSLEKNDPRNQAKLLATSTDVTKTGDRSFRGTIDLSKSPSITPQMAKILGTKAQKVPFEAQTDEQGRLTRMSIDMESLAKGAGESEATYYDFGVPVPVEAPAAGEVIEVPAKMLKLMGG